MGYQQVVALIIGLPPLSSCKTWIIYLQEMFYEMYFLIEIFLTQSFVSRIYLQPDDFNVEKCIIRYKIKCIKCPLPFLSKYFTHFLFLACCFRRVVLSVKICKSVGILEHTHPPHTSSPSPYFCCTRKSI